MKTKKIIEIILAAILSASSFINMIHSHKIDSFFENSYVIAILIFCALALAGLLFYDLYVICHSTHYFMKGSREFCCFFEKWYSKPGDLTIICDDLNWTAEKIEGNSPILDALEKKAKSKQLVLYLKDIQKTKPEIIKRLSGSVLRKAQTNIVNRYSLSCLNYMGNNSAVIVRDKNNDDGDWIIFQEVGDTYVTQLLNALLEG